MKRLLLCCVMFAWTMAVVADPADDRIEDARLAVRTKDFPRAVGLLVAEARAGSAEAQYLLGLARANGLGGELDMPAARDLLASAARQGHERAAHALAALLAGGDPSQRREAAEWLALAARKGYAPAVAAQAAGGPPPIDARVQPGRDEEFRWQIALYAARGDAIELLRAIGVRELLTRRDEFGRTLLMVAVEQEATRAVDELLSAPVDVGAKDQFGRTALMLAARSRRVEVTRRLLAAGARVDDVDQARRGALFHAAAADMPDQARLLLDARAPLDGRDVQGANALDVALKRGSAATAEVLRLAGARPTSTAALARGAAFDATRTGALHEGWPPLLVAVARDDEADVRRRAAAGESLALRTPRGESALRVAIEARAASALSALLELGSDPHAKEAGLDAVARIARAGDAPLIRTLAAHPSLGAGDRTLLLTAAVRQRDLALVRTLLALGSAASAMDADGDRPLTCAAARGDLEIVKLLLDRGASAVEPDAHGRGPLLRAIAARQHSVVALLLALHVPVNDAAEDGLTPLVAAVRTGDVALVRQLLQAGALVDKAVSGSSPLHVAAELGASDTLEALLAHRPQLDALDAFGETPLLVAARLGHEPVCARLLDAGADRRLRGRDRATAAEVAEARGFVALARRLRG